MSGNIEKPTLVSTHSGQRETTNQGNLSSQVEALFVLLETSGKSSHLQEIKQLINEQYSDVKEPWLVYGLYDTFSATKSPKCLELLLDVRKDPHDRFLMDKICESLKQRGTPRAIGMEVLGYIIRKNPSWLYRILSHGLMKQWIKILKTEDDFSTILSGVLNLLVFITAVPGNLADHLDDIFHIFSRLAAFRLQILHQLPEIQQIHLDVTLHAYFHRLFGMYPCNFLHYLRTEFSDVASKEAQALFFNVIRPIMSTVRMSPQLVRNAREHEKSIERWKRMEVHDVIVESSRISLFSQECTGEESLDMESKKDIHEIPVGPFLSFQIPLAAVEKSHVVTSHIVSVTTVTTTSTMTEENRASIERDLQTNLSPGTSSTITINSHGNNLSHAGRKSLPPSRLATLEPPPEPAIEATPETTPFVTPLKEDVFRFSRAVPSSTVTRQLNLDIAAGPSSPTQVIKGITSCKAEYGLPLDPTMTGVAKDELGSFKQPSSSFHPMSPTSSQKDTSPFRFPELPHHLSTIGPNLASNTDRRDSLFERTDQLVSRLTLQSSARHRNASKGTLTQPNTSGVDKIVTPSSSKTLTAEDGTKGNIHVVCHIYSSAHCSFLSPYLRLKKI